VAISCVDITRQLTAGPCVSSKCIAVHIFATVFSLKSTIDHSALFIGGSGMVRDLARASAFGGKLFPRNNTEGVLVQILKGREVQAPHRIDRALFQVSTSMNVQVLFAVDALNERAMI